ncbi:MAG: hypothetical protein ACJ8E7_09510 [Sphingomicrobium sp.]
MPVNAEPQPHIGVGTVMRGLASLMLLSGGLLLLGCAKRDPVDEDAVNAPDEVVGDASATGLAAPANAAAAEAARQAALPVATGGLNWSYRAADEMALFGPPGTPAFSIQCDKPPRGRGHLVFVRYLPPTGGGNATLSFTGNGKVASVPIAAVTNPNGLGGQWRAAIPVDDSVRDAAEAFAGPGMVNISITGLAPLVVPAAAAPRRVFADCLGG